MIYAADVGNFFDSGADGGCDIRGLAQELSSLDELDLEGLSGAEIHANRGYESRSRVGGYGYRWFTND